MKKIVTLAVICAGLSACATENSRVTFDGQNFRGSAKPEERRVKEVFVASVRDVSKSPEGAREALRYEGTKYCIRRFGSSEIEWETDPEADDLRAVDNTFTVRGRCVD